MRGTELSRRELEVAAGVHVGLLNKQIGARLGIDETTVKTHLHRVFQKLGIRSRVEVALWYERRNQAAHPVNRLAGRLRELAAEIESLHK